MAAPLVPAQLSFTGQGVPFSEAFGDVYHGGAGGPAQARHVFLAGNRLPERWAGRERFVILETGFGAGINFLATWQAWRRDPQRCTGARCASASATTAPSTCRSRRACTISRSCTARSAATPRPSGFTGAR